MDTVEPASRGKQYFYDTPVKKWTLRDARLHFDNDDDTDENLKQTLLSLEKSLNSSRAKKARALLKRLKRKHSRRAQKNSSSSPPSTSEHNVTVNINQTYQLQVPANDNDSNSESDSFKSQDHNPKSKKRVHVDIYDDKIDALNTAVDDSDKWFLGNVDLSEYLFDFRRESRDMMADKLDMELCPARLLSLGNIFLFTHRRTHSCISDLPKNLIAEIYASIDGSDDCLAIMPPVNEWIHRVTSIVTKDHANEAEMMIILGQMLVEAASSPSNNDIAIKSANVIFDLTRGFARIAAQVEMFEDKRGAYCEDTFVHQIVAPFLRNIFYGSLLGSHWANAQLAACAGTGIPTSTTASALASLTAKMLPDFIVYAYVRSIRFDLLAVEIKPPESNKGEDDKRKIARELHLMINALVDNGVESPIVCGISVDGFKCATYQMDLKYDGIYRLTELSQFELPSNMEELGKSKRCLASFIKVQELISSTAERIENCLKSKRCTLNTVDPKLVPKEEWKRPSQDILSKMNKRPKK